MRITVLARLGLVVLASTGRASAAEPPRPSLRFEAVQNARERLTTSGDALSADLLAWNKGSLGEPTCSPVTEEGHPDPRVVVNVLAAKGGGRTTEEIERVLRKYHWSNIVRCYAAAAASDPTMGGKIFATFQISRAGKIGALKLKKRELRDKALAGCMVSSLPRVAMTAARGITHVSVEMRVYPGDDPPPPPPGTSPDLAPGSLSRAARAELPNRLRPGLEACADKITRCQPALWGRLGMRVDIDAEGRVVRAFETESTFPQPAFTQCALRAVRSQTLPRPDGEGGSVVVPVRVRGPKAPVAPPASDGP